MVSVVNDPVGPSKLGAFQKRFPDRPINVGISEQLIGGVGAGLANGGRIFFVSAASCFQTNRSQEQIKADIAYCELGATHHALKDFAWLRSLNSIIIAPADTCRIAETVKWAAGHDGPNYLRLSRMPLPDLGHSDRLFSAGKAELVRQGGDVAILACGTTVHLATSPDALAAAGIAARVPNFPTINPPGRRGAACRRRRGLRHLGRGLGPGWLGRRGGRIQHNA